EAPRLGRVAVVVGDDGHRREARGLARPLADDVALRLRGQHVGGAVVLVPAIPNGGRVGREREQVEGRALVVERFRVRRTSRGSDHEGETGEEELRGPAAGADHINYDNHSQYQKTRTNVLRSRTPPVSN